MPSIKEIDGRSMFSIYDEGNTHISNFMSLIVSDSGGGKSVLTESIAWKMYKHGYKVIFATEKPMSEFGNAFCNFPVDKEYHLQALADMGVEPLPLEVCKELVHIIHPFTFDIPRNKKLPPIDFYTIPLNTIDETGFAAITTGETDMDTTRICKDTAEKLKPTENLWDFVWKACGKIMVEKGKYSHDPDDLSAPIESEGSVQVAKKIKGSFKPFRQHFMLQPPSHPLNIHLKDIINDQKRITFLSTKWIENDRVRYFVILNFLKQLEKALKEGVKHPLLLIFEEIKILLPRSESSKTTVQSLLSEVIKKQLATIRTAGRGTSIIGTSQTYSDTDPQFARGATVKIYGKMNSEDQKKLTSDFMWGKEQLELMNDIYTAQRGQFTLHEHLAQGYNTKYKARMPPFAHQEEGEQYIEKYKQLYPDKAKDISILYDQLFDERKSAEKEAEIRLRKKETEDAQKEENKKPAKAVKEKTEDPNKMKLQKMVDKAKQSKAKQAYELKKENNKLSWREVGRRLGISPHTAKNYATEYAKLQGDHPFAQQHA